MVSNFSAKLASCDSCRYKNNDEDGREWDYCARPNYPPGNWNMLIHVQRYGGHSDGCNGSHWKDKGADSAIFEVI